MDESLEKELRKKLKETRLSEHSCDGNVSYPRFLSPDDIERLLPLIHAIYLAHGYGRPDGEVELEESFAEAILKLCNDSSWLVPENPYPESIFPSMSKTDLGEAHKLLSGIISGGLDRLSGSWGREVWNNAMREMDGYHKDREEQE